MQADVEPASNREFGSVLPSLEAIVVAKVVSRLPVVERLVTVLNGSEQRRDDVRCEEEVERGNGFDDERLGCSVETTS